MTEDFVNLQQFIVAYFSLEELHNLCFALFVDYEAFESKGKIGQARELVQYMDRRGRLNELHAALARERPSQYKQRFGDTKTVAERGDAHRMMNRYDEALADFNWAIELDPKYAFAIASRGATYRMMNRYDKALADLNRAIKLDPKYAFGFYNRGETYRMMNRYDEALADFDRAIELDPNDTWAISQREEVYRLRRHQDKRFAES